MTSLKVVFHSIMGAIGDFGISSATRSLLNKPKPAPSQPAPNRVITLKEKLDKREGKPTISSKILLNHKKHELFMQTQNEVWTAPDFEAVSTNMECTAYSETL